ncbi:MAG: hypothetical protein JWM03_1265 [Rhodocyclales bacterium]|nr:hypothetical protein [Rhodocyclales bacterium]MDB5888393.1 hypothetical protein [Rhodocyclales bacterium]
MLVVLNNPILYVVDYPSVDGLEAIDKRRAKGVFLYGTTAQKFRDELADALSHGEGADELDICLDQFEALFTQPAIYQ